MKNLYGTPVMTISKIVKNLMIEQENNNQNHYVGNLVRATRVFKDLLKDTIWSTRYKVLNVNKIDNSVVMPQDMVRLYNINVKDSSGQLVPIACNPNMSTINLLCSDSLCSCSSCNGTGSLCDALDAIQIINEDISINGFPFTIKTWIQKFENGVIKKVIETPYPVLPYPSSGAPEVTVRTSYETLCVLDVTETNCIKVTEPNHSSLFKFCGCYIPEWQSRMCGYMNGIGPLSPSMNLTDINPTGATTAWISDYYSENSYFPQSDYGYWNWEVNANEKVFLKMIRTDRVVVCYQTNGDNCNGDEIVVPEYALDAMQYGIIHRQMAFNPSKSIADRSSAERAYEKAKDKLNKFLHPVNPKTIADMQDIIPKW